MYINIVLHNFRRAVKTMMPHFLCVLSLFLLFAVRFFNSTCLPCCVVFVIVVVIIICCYCSCCFISSARLVSCRFAFVSAIVVQTNCQQKIFV